MPTARWPYPGHWKDSTALIRIRLRDAVQAGLRVFESENTVLLTEGFCEGNRIIGLPPNWFVDATDLNTGRVIEALPVPGVDAEGRPEGAETLVSQTVLSSEEAERVRRRIGYTKEALAHDQDAVKEFVNWGVADLEDKNRHCRAEAPRSWVRTGRG